MGGGYVEFIRLFSVDSQWLSSENYTSSVGDTGSVSELGRSPGEGNGNSLQYSCLENPMGRGVSQATVHGITKSQTQLKQLSTHIHYSSVYFVDGSKEFKVEKDMRTSYIMAVCYCQNGPGTC